MSERYTTIGEQWNSVISGGASEFRSQDGLEVRVLNWENVRRVFLPENSEMPAVLFISGTSESGKSTFGKLAVEAGVGHRLKIYRTLAEIAGERDLPKMENNPFNYATSLGGDPKLIEVAGQRIMARYVDLMRKTDVPVAIVETIKHEWMVECFRGNPGIRFLSISIDADLEKRVAREAEKTGKPISEIREEVVRKDAWKLELGSGAVGKTADIYVLNNGSYNAYEQMVRSLLAVLQKSSRDYSGKAHDYSLG